MRYQSFDPSNCGFPQPRVPVLPPLGRRALAWRGPTAARALTTAPNARFYTRGRYAMTEAYRLCGVGPDAPLLAPAYHCRTMLDPAIRLGADVLLYPVTQALKPDLAGLAACLAASAKRPAALLVTHYFGFAQALDELLAFCRESGLALIEDCAHCLFLPGQSAQIGLQGRYCVSSPYKFFAIEDGGVLWANQQAPLPTQPLQAQGMVQEIKGLARAAQRAWSQTPLDDTAAYGAAASVDTAGNEGEDRLHDSETPSAYYDVSAEHAQALAVSRLLLGHTDTERLSRLRRSHYRAWLQAVSGLPNCQPLYADLPQDTVPYMFPLRIDHPEQHFYQLKRSGVPVWRWDDMAVSSCAPAMDFRTHLLHLPCHQALTPNQMRWMTGTVAAVMTGQTVGGSS